MNSSYRARGGRFYFYLTARVAAVAVITAAPSPARAEEAPRPPPAYHAPSKAELPPEDEETYEDRLREETPKRVNSPGKLAAGIVLTILGPASIVGGNVLIASNSSFFSGRDNAAFGGGTAMILGGGVLMGIGIWLIVVGGKRVPNPPISASPSPTIFVGPTGGAVRVSF